MSAARLEVGRRQLASACIGNVLEFYDFVVYSFMAGTIAAKFFPSQSEVASLLGSFAAFGIGFLARPLGGVIIGRIGDRRGRRAALLITIFGMAVGTVGLGLLPTYETIGIFAPVLLVAMRLIQGLAAGGEWGGATTFIAESAPKGRRGFYGGIGQASIASAAVLSNFVIAMVNLAFSHETMQDWGWRVPFLLGGMLLPIGFLLRRRMVETPHFLEAQRKASEAAPLHRLSALAMVSKAFGFTIVWTVSYYVMINYMPTFMQKHGGLTESTALWIGVVATSLLVVMTPLFGLLSDKIGRKPLLLACCVAMIIMPYIVFSLVVSHQPVAVITIALIVGNVFLAAFSGAGPAALAEIFPTRSRSTLMSTGYSLSTAIFGGFAPFISVWLINETGSPMSPTFYVAAAGIVSGLVIWTFQETAHHDLR